MRLANLLQTSAKHVTSMALLSLVIGVSLINTLIAQPDPLPEQRILFLSDQHDPNWRLYSMKPDGTDVQQVAEYPDESSIGFRFVGADLAPDGRTLAYAQVTCPDPNDMCDTTLHLLNIESGATQSISDGKEDGNPLWSPNGEYIAYYNRATFPYAAVVEISTGEIVLDIGIPLLAPLGDGSAGLITGMSWAPNGERLVISVSNPPDGDESLYLVTLEGAVERISESLEGRSPAWQADSEVIYYGCIGERLAVCRVDLATREWEQVPGLLSQLEVIAPEGAVSRRFSINENGELLISISSYHDSARSTPNYDIYLYETNTNILTNLTENAEYNSYHPRWYTVPSAEVLPTADAGPDQTLTVDASGFATVTLDGSGSFDPDGEIFSYVWTLDGVEIATGVSPTVTLEVGEHVITLTITDNDDATASDTVTITVVAASTPTATSTPTDTPTATLTSTPSP